MEGSKCECGKELDRSSYGKRCRDCYEDWMRHQAKDAYYQCEELVYKRYMMRENREIRRTKIPTRGVED